MLTKHDVVKRSNLAFLKYEHGNKFSDLSN
jgi:hypothetical protein